MSNTMFFEYFSKNYKGSTLWKSLSLKNTKSRCATPKCLNIVKTFYGAIKYVICNGKIGWSLNFNHFEISRPPRGDGGCLRGAEDGKTIFRRFFEKNKILKKKIFNKKFSNKHFEKIFQQRFFQKNNFRKKFVEKKCRKFFSIFLNPNLT